MKTLKIKVLITVLFIVTILGIAGAVVAESRQVAGAADGREKYFTSEYVEEVCETNHIYDGEIKEGMYLVVPYYK